MAQHEAVWVLHKEADDMILAMIKSDHLSRYLAHIDPEVIGCAAITGKEKPESQSWDAQIEGIKEPSALWSKKIYCIKFYQSTWDRYTEEMRQHMLFKQLLRIPDDCNGKVLPFDLQDNYMLVKTYGTDYMNKINLPNLLTNPPTFGGTDKQD